MALVTLIEWCDPEYLTTVFTVVNLVHYAIFVNVEARGSKFRNTGVPSAPIFRTEHALGIDGTIVRMKNFLGYHFTIFAGTDLAVVC